ncbi:hypothetical protein DOM21_10830 [Bacteriovorax stolpii]|uniref:Uncharacterized protein n=1 Tax=Bacteriovorax stolpii TaxID=960 RepID=A0A2K9NRF0_BACTC|nr:hypothetical protein [Bacteriovorax stolpii]AUN98089.1 hypothetical protein C0V70_08195 [Bacteriovorax stolpii]QDK41931.1 hypothetical protein DOM21_10830 [Bacteriovorax stolpii]TDP52003.1 hypothetical protein C8D79_2649 [Bacteriovorax stolpii]
MKSLIFTIVCLFVLESAHAFEREGRRWSVGSNDVPSCVLYRKRVANYYQRLSEVTLAEKITKGELTLKEVIRMTELWKRTNIPLNLEAVAIYKERLILTPSEMQFFKHENTVEVQSEFFNWVNDRFVLPESVMLFSINEKSGIIDVEISLPYVQACLGSYGVDVFLTRPTGERYQLQFSLDKHRSDRYDLIQGNSGF